jgi:hypothetical protein
MTESAPIPIDESAPNPPVRNAAVLRCLAPRDLSLAESSAIDLDKHKAKVHAAQVATGALRREPTEIKEPKPTQKGA